MSLGGGASAPGGVRRHTQGGRGVEGSCPYCDFCTTAKMGLCRQRQIWDKAGLPPFY